MYIGHVWKGMVTRLRKTVKDYKGWKVYGKTDIAGAEHLTSYRLISSNR
jgi:hypothetical protein